MVVPSLEGKAWPTLGPQVCDFIEEFLVFGPGDLRGEPAVLDDEKRALIYRMYEVYPKSHREAGRRRFRRVAISLRKGTAKTELAAWIAAVELHPDGPVRCDGFDARGQPVGVGVVDPYIPLIAYTEEQSEELAYGALLAILGEGPLANDFDLGLTRILRKDGAGKAVALAGAPGPRDGARTTWECFDETHRMTRQSQRDAHRTMLANLPKRRLADAWALETTTAFSPGAGSIAEDTMDYARLIDRGKIQDPKLFFFHRQAGDGHDLQTKEGIRAAIIEASGPAAAWSDIDGIAHQWQDPTADRSFLERVWLNRPTKGSERAFDVQAWKTLAREGGGWPEKGRLITLGFDGSRFRDATALVGCDIIDGYLFLLGLWEEPPHVTEWEVPVPEVHEAVQEAFATWKVWRMYADPPYWDGAIAEWVGKYGETRVIEWWTNRPRQMGYCVRGFVTALTGGDVSHDGSADLGRHLGNAVKRPLPARDDEGRPLWTIQKERHDSPHKIDAAMAALLAWEARGDAVASGLLTEPEYDIVFIGGG